MSARIASITPDNPKSRSGSGLLGTEPRGANLRQRDARSIRRKPKGMPCYALRVCRKRSGRPTRSTIVPDVSIPSRNEHQFATANTHNEKQRVTCVNIKRAYDVYQDLDVQAARHFAPHAGASMSCRVLEAGFLVASVALQSAFVR